MPEYSGERPVAQQPLIVEWIGNTSLRTTRHSAFLQEEVAKCLTVVQHSRIQRCCSERSLSGCQTSEHSALLSEKILLPEYSGERPVAQQPLTVEWIGNTSLRTTRHSAFLQEEVAKCLTVMQHSGIWHGSAEILAVKLQSIQWPLLSEKILLPEYSGERPVAQQPLTVEWIGNTSLRTTRHSAFLQEEVAKCLTVVQHS